MKGSPAIRAPQMKKQTKKQTYSVGPFWKVKQMIQGLDGEKTDLENLAQNNTKNTNEWPQIFVIGESEPIC